jgi:hypothetical protein
LAQQRYDPAPDDKTVVNHKTYLIDPETRDELFLIGNHAENTGTNVRSIFVASIPGTLGVNWTPSGGKRIVYMLCVSQRWRTHPLPSRVSSNSLWACIVFGFSGIGILLGLWIAKLKNWSKMLVPVGFCLIGFCTGWLIAERFYEYDVYLDNASDAGYLITFENGMEVQLPPKSHILVSVPHGKQSVTIQNEVTLAHTTNELILDDDEHGTYVWNLFGINTYQIVSRTYSN